jgi:predicted N-acetyltransferase YhbS
MGALSAPQPIDARHQLSGFASGKPPLDDWLKQRALKSEGRSARTYVVCDGDVVVGYYCFSAGSVRLSDAPKPMQRNMPDPLPIILLGRLAVDTNHQGRGIGKGMLKDALLRATEVSRLIGARAVMVHAIDDEAVQFYLATGFIRSPDLPQKLYLPLGTVGAAL